MGWFDVRVKVHIERAPEEIWDYVSDVASHVEWMLDARSIDFLSDQRVGVGTRYNCLTVLGPLRTNDVITITEWQNGAVMGVRHSGVVTGEGKFTLRPVVGGTEFQWYEALQFPWFFGGKLGELIAAPLFRWIWRRDLTALKQQLEAADRGHGDV